MSRCGDETPEKRVDAYRDSVLKEEIAAMLQVFGEELTNPGFTDEAARVEFYTFSGGLVPEAQKALLSCLQENRPHVAQLIREELDGFTPKSGGM